MDQVEKALLIAEINVKARQLWLGFVDAGATFQQARQLTIEVAKQLIDEELDKRFPPQV